MMTFKKDGIEYALYKKSAAVFSCERELVNVAIPESISVNDRQYKVTSIGRTAFANSYASLETVTLPNTVTKILERGFYSCKKLRHVNLPPKLKEIGAMAFAFCESLETISLPDTVSKIGISAFNGCESLKSVKLSSQIRIIPDYCFARCFSLKDLVIPASVEELGYQSFAFCSALDPKNIPDTVKVDEYAFVKF